MAVAGHYRKKLEKDDLKRLSKEVAKKLVRGDYKSGRVKDPAAKISSKHEKTVKNYVKDFMDKAVRKKEEREKAKATRGEGEQDDKDATPVTPQLDVNDTPGIAASPNDDSELKRKREDEADESPRNIRSRTDEPPVPPPPPPPPADDLPMDIDEADLTPMNGGSLGLFAAGTPSNGTLPLRGGDQPSPMQLATPPTNGSGEGKSNGSSNLR